MGIVSVIVGGCVLMTIVAIIGDYMSKARLQAPAADTAALRGLSDRIEALEAQARERDAKIERLEGDLAFTTRLLEAKHDTDQRTG
ncbi:MAG: hypothetical protein KKA67_10375 [Spirochaetes bacterium]|nr:hypothetical protein [Spirochaetota bacterium]MBU1078885.1 hypothetical protein [Spirochaetota bacterium]